jgi:23S rRNA pseudouridine955/2504/2580 synthase
MNSPAEEPVPLHSPKSAVELRTITEDESGQRLDNYLMRVFKTVPRTRVYRLLRKGEVRVNKKRVDAEYRLAAGDEVRLPPVKLDAATEPGRPSTSLLELIEKSVIFQDKNVMVLDKPAGVAVHGGSGMSFGVIEALRASRPRETLELVHRLDRDTSGCLLISRNRATLVSLHALIREGGIHKTYLALVSGSWQLGTKRIDAPLATDAREHGERHVRVNQGGKDSVSIFKPVQFFGSLATLMEVDIPTGRTHQIRVHSSFAGHPLLGDDKYGDRERNAVLKSHGLKRTFLHAQSVAFEWPGSGVPFHVSAPLPAELSAVIDEITPMKRKTSKGAARGSRGSAPSGFKAARPAGKAAVAGHSPAGRAPAPTLGSERPRQPQSSQVREWSSSPRARSGAPRPSSRAQAPRARVMGSRGDAPREFGAAPGESGSAPRVPSVARAASAAPRERRPPPARVKSTARRERGNVRAKKSAAPRETSRAPREQSRAPREPQARARTSRVEPRAPREAGMAPPRRPVPREKSWGPRTTGTGRGPRPARRPAR